MIIRWTPRALKTNLRIIDYLNNNWTKKEVNKFVHQTNKIIEEIKQNPYMFQVFCEKRNIRKGFLNRLVSLYYRVNNEKGEVELLVFWQNRQDPENLKIG